MKIGSEAHKELFCRTFLETYQDYDPYNLPWPHLDEQALALLRGIPFWGEALGVEVKAGAMIDAFVETVTDPLLNEAIALQGREETRHSKLLQAMIEHFGIEGVQRPAPTVPANLDVAFKDLGHEECLDSFLAFGLFELAHQARVFPEMMFTIFDPILDEEARHIVFFVNWMAYMQVNQGQGLGLIRGTRSLWYYGRALNRLVSSVSQGNADAPGFLVSGASAFPFELTAEQFLATCLSENERRMSKFDPDLLRPQLMPTLATAALRTIRLAPRKTNPIGNPNMG